MAIKYINNGSYATSGYTLSGAFSSLTIGTSGTIGGPGLSGGNQYFTIFNRGHVTGAEVGMRFVDATIENVGSIEAGTATGNKPSGIGVDVSSGGKVINDTSGVIEAVGSLGIGVELALGTVSNSGTIKAVQAGGVGISLSSTSLSVSGLVVNSPDGLIEGYADGIFAHSIYPSNCTVENEGTIDATGTRGIGVDFTSRGTVANASSGLISGVYIASDGIVTNAGTIMNGVNLRGGGYIVNERGGFIEGVDISSGSGLVVNSGTIDAPKSTGVYLGYGNFTNTASGLVTGDVILGRYNYSGTVINDGILQGVEFYATGCTLIDEAGSTIVGVVGGSGTLELVGSPGTLSGLGSSFSGFRTVEVLAGANWRLIGADVVASGTTRLIDGGILTLAGTSTIAGTVTGAGTLTLAGTETLATGAVLSVSHVTLSGGSVTLAKNLTYNGSFVQTAGPIKVTGDTLVLTGSDTLVNGAINGSGFLATYGAVALTNYTINAGATWQVYGTTTAAASITLGNGGGGSGRLAIETGGVYDITGNGGIVVAPGGSGTVGNFALFEKTGGTGISTIAAAFTNSGTIAANAGALDISGAVGGTGRASIGATGVLRFDGTVASTQTIAFAGTTGGRLALNDPSGTGLGFAGAVSGFSGKDQLDLTTFAFSAAPTISWNQTSSSGGTLTVVDGSKIAKITLFGQYVQAGFGKAEDGGSGTDITYTTPSQVVLASPHR